MPDPYLLSLKRRRAPDPSLAPCTPDVQRALTSLVVATDAQLAADVVGLAMATVLRASQGLPVNRRTRTVAARWAAEIAR